MIARMTTYRFRVDPHDIARRAEDGLLPILQKQSGFRAYSLFSDRSEVQRGPRGMGAPQVRQIIAITVWDSFDNAKAGVQAAWDWVREHLGEELEWTDTEFVDVLLDTSLEIRP